MTCTVSGPQHGFSSLITFVQCLICIDDTNINSNVGRMRESREVPEVAEGPHEQAAGRVALHAIWTRGSGRCRFDSEVAHVSRILDRLEGSECRRDLLWCQRAAVCSRMLKSGLLQRVQLQRRNSKLHKELLWQDFARSRYEFIRSCEGYDSSLPYSFDFERVQFQSGVLLSQSKTLLTF